MVKSFDFTKEYPSDVNFSHDDVKVVYSSLGSYREAEAIQLSRFGYRFTIEHLGKQHLVGVRYPDDKRRFMCKMDRTTYDMKEGSFTGVNQPLSHKMIEIRKIFWPRWKECSIVFMTLGHGEPAAVADVRIYELDALPPLTIAKNKDSISVGVTAADSLQEPSVKPILTIDEKT